MLQVYTHWIGPIKIEKNRQSMSHTPEEKVADSLDRGLSENKQN